MTLRVDNIPWYLKPLFWIYSYGVAALLYLYLNLVRLTSKIEVVGEQNASQLSNAIVAMWHREVFPSFCSGIYKHWKFVLINHPAWHMRHIHILLCWIGCKRIYLGSTGYGGREAADKVVQDLKEGESTFINPDGPYGPSKVLRKGVLHMSLQSQVPILPVRFETPRQWTLKDWDRKRFPYPFSSIRIIYEAPVFVTESNFEASAETLTKRLG